MINKTTSHKNSNNSGAFPAKSGNSVESLVKPSSWPFPPPGGPQGPLKQTRSKKTVIQTQEFDQAPF